MYKVQGETLNSMIIARWKDVKFYNKQQAYICVSRVTNGESFGSMDEFTEEHKEQFKPSYHTHVEDKRLRQLSQRFFDSAEIKELFEYNYDLSHKQQHHDDKIDSIIHKHPQCNAIIDSTIKASSSNATVQEQLKITNVPTPKRKSTNDLIPNDSLKVKSIKFAGTLF